jgi:hypothetical protein
VPFGPYLVLLTDIPSPQADFQNQGAQELAREYDPDGKRTIGQHNDN